MADFVSIKDVVTIGSSVGAPVIASTIGSSIPGAGAAISSITSVLGAVGATGGDGLLDLATGIYDSFFYHVLYDFINTPTMMPIWICYIGSEGLTQTVNAFKTLDEHGHGAHSSIDLQGLVNIFSAQRPLLPLGTIGMGVFLCQGVITPSDSITVRRDSYNAPIGGFLPGLIGDTRQLSEVSISFLENNASFVDFVLRPWLVQNSYQGIPFAKKANITMEQFTKTTKNGPLLLRKRFTLHNAFPTQIDSERLQYRENTNDTRQIQFAYESYKMHGGMGGFDVTTILSRLAQIALSFAQESGYSAAAPGEDQKDINDIIRIVTNGRVDPQAVSTETNRKAQQVTPASTEPPSQAARRGVSNISITPEDLIQQTTRSTVIRTKKVSERQIDTPDTQELRNNISPVIPDELDIIDALEIPNIARGKIKINQNDNITGEVDVNPTIVDISSNDILSQNNRVQSRRISQNVPDTPTVNDVQTSPVKVSSNDTVQDVQVLSKSIPTTPTPSSTTVSNFKLIPRDDVIQGEQTVNSNNSISVKPPIVPDNPNSLTISSNFKSISRQGSPAEQTSGNVRLQTVNKADVPESIAVSNQPVKSPINDINSGVDLRAQTNLPVKDDTAPITISSIAEQVPLSDTSQFNNVASKEIKIAATGVPSNQVQSKIVSIPIAVPTTKNVQSVVQQRGVTEEDVTSTGLQASNNAIKILSTDSPLYVPYGRANPLKRIASTDVPSTLKIPVAVKTVKS